MWGRSVIFLFVAVWAGAGAVWIILDWLGNPSRGSFRPTGRRRLGSHRSRQAERLRQRAEGDAAIRATLRDKYGQSSLRLTWNQQRELRSIEADSELITDPYHAARRLPDLEFEPVLLEAEFEDPESAPPFEPAAEVAVPVEKPPPTRWKRGDDVLVATRNRARPPAATVRSRVWKNHSKRVGWGAANATRMAAGKPPRRFNPLSGKVETAKVDVGVGRPYWSDVAIDPFRTVPT